MFDLKIAVAGFFCFAAISLGGADQAETARAERATQFAQHLTAQRIEAALALGSEQLQNTLTAEMSAQLIASLEAQKGAFQSCGSAWFTDALQGYQRFRVPLTFENGKLDLQIVIDQHNRVAGVGVLEHVTPPQTDAPTGTTELEFPVGPEGKELGGTLLLPAGKGPFPVVVMVHGSGPNDRDGSVMGNKPLRDLARGLAARGVASLRYDKRSFARPEDYQAIGPKLTVQQEVIDDAWAALAQVRKHPAINAKRVYLIGHSLGGQLAPRIAAGAQPAVAGVIILAGSTRPLPEKVIEQSEYLAAVDGTVDQDEAKSLAELKRVVALLRTAMQSESPGEGFYLGAPVAYFKDLETYDAPATAAKLGLPVLAIQGGRDYQVTSADFALWSRALQGKTGACLKQLAALDHLLRNGEGASSPADYAHVRPVADEVIETIAKFVTGGGC